MRFEIHAHSMYSNIRLIDCIIKPKDLILTAYKKGLAGITLTDHEALCGHIDWLNAEKELKSKGDIPEDFVCALGNEIYLSDTRGELNYYPHFILIAKNKQGHRALRELSSTAWYNSYFHKRMERVPTTKEELAQIVHKYPNSLIASSACLGSEVAHLTKELVQLESEGTDEVAIYNKKIEIIQFCDMMQELFGNDFYLEVAPSKSKDQISYNKRIKEIAAARNIKLVFGGDAHYLTEEDRPIHKAFLNSKDGEREVDDFYHYAYLMDDNEAFINCGGVFTKEEFDNICATSIEIMNKIEHYDLDRLPVIPTTPVVEYNVSKYANLNNYPTLSTLLFGTIQERYWINQCLSGLERIHQYNPQYLQRLEEEADIIKVIGQKLEIDLFSYFNTFQSYIDLFWECGSIVGPGRGSSVCYLSNYLLGITQLDPIEYNLPAFRFLNKERLELPDIDIDLSPSKRPLIFEKIRERVGETNLLQVATFTTVGSRSAVLTACRGYRSKYYPSGIDTDIAQYISSMIPQERGFLWSITEMVYGNEEKGRIPNQSFINEVNKYPKLLDIMLGIEGLVTTRSQHASGVIIYNTSCCETNALMRSPGGNLTTQFALHQSEQAGDVKFDFLVTEICDKLITTIGLLQEDGYFPTGSLREIYNKYLHPSKLDLSDNRIWEALGNGSVLDVFQFSTQVGLQAATSIKPTNPTEMMMANALTRLVGEKGKERPIDRYVRMKNNIGYWYKEVHDVGLTQSEIQLLEPFYLATSGCPTTQEKLMLICMNVANFSLKDANAARKIVSKKQINKVPQLKAQFEAGCGSKALANYVWDTCMAPQMSYSFAEPHALAYSFVGIQTLYLATTFPQLYWNCACIISDSGGIYDVWDTDDDEYEVDNKKKKTVNYGKIATAIGKTRSAGINIIPPDINKSKYTFSPDINNNAIRYGLSGITKVGTDLVKDIISARPYNSLDDFLRRIKVNKPQMVNLIKSGAFDGFGKDRFDVMRQYIDLISDKKKRITLQNMKMLIDFNLLPSNLEFECTVFNFNKYLKKYKSGDYYVLDANSTRFYEAHFDMDKLFVEDEQYKLPQTIWDAMYKKLMDPVRAYMKQNQEDLLNKLNQKLFDELWDKYCTGTISKWEMDSVSYYSHEHELANVDLSWYDCVNYFTLPDEPIIDNKWWKDGKQIVLYKIFRIAGTILEKDKNKGLVTLLTKEGVVTVKIFGPVFTTYDKQISERRMDGTKKIIEKSWLSRGNKIIVTGIKRDDSFLAKKYARTPYHLVELIDTIDENGNITTKQYRYGEGPNDN
jgi:DNA polymerase III subunit alpha